MSEWVWREALKRAKENHPLMKETRRQVSSKMFRAYGEKSPLRRCEGCADWGKECKGEIVGKDCWHPEGSIRVDDEKPA